MRIRSAMTTAVLGCLLGLPALVSLAGPVSAQRAEPCPPGQPPGRPPGQPTSPPGQPTGRPPQYPPGKCQLRLDRNAGAPGETVAVSGDGFVPGSRVNIVMGGTTLATVTADPEGRVATSVVIPPDLAAGPYDVVATGPAAAGGTHVLSASFTVGGAAAPTRGRLPRTGSSSPLPLVLVSGSLVLVGSAAVLAARRRRRTS